MHAASRQALRTLRQRLEPVTGRPAGAQSLVDLARELAAVADLLTKQPRLRRVIADPSTEADRRADLMARLLTGKVGGNTLQLVREAAALRWSTPWDLVDALELIGADVLLAAAENDGVLDQVEDELFRFERILDAYSDLAALLDEAIVPADRRIQLLDEVLGGKVHQITRELLAHAVASPRRRAMSFAIDDLLDAAAARRERSIAKVISAVPLTEEQENRLAEALSEQYHRAISVRVAIEPRIRGGLVVRVGDEVIDGSVASRLTEIRRALAG
ncbi:MAG TPA: F0F1 ATP synthase subunit delta [Jatrophihabitans sp.]|nr:F0F1 ATP synthase subunit delta [Jatrophihabitans sp.]